MPPTSIAGHIHRADLAAGQADVCSVAVWPPQAVPPHLRNLVASELCNGAAHALHAMVAVSEEALRCQSCQLR